MFNKEVYKKFLLTTLKESTQENILLQNNDFTFLYKKSFKYSDSFKELYDSYLEQVTVPYQNLKKMNSEKFSRLKFIKIVKQDKDVGFVMLEQDGDSCFVTPFIIDNDLTCIEQLIKKIDRDFLDKVGIKNVETLYFVSYNQTQYETLYEKNLTHFATEFYKQINYNSEPNKNDYLFKKKDGEIEYLYIYNKDGLDSDLLKQYDEDFFYEDLPNQDDYESKYNPKKKCFDYLIKISLKPIRGEMVDIGILELENYDNYLTIAPYIRKSSRKEGLYSYFIRNFNKCSWIFKKKPEYLVAYVFTKNKASTKAHEKLFKNISYKCYKKDI